MLMRLAVEQATDAVVITDAQLDRPGPRIVYANAAFLQMTGYELSEVIGQTPRLLQGPETSQELLQWLRHCLEEKIPFYGEGVNYRKGGRPYQAEWRITPVRADGAEVTHFMATLRDVTDRKQMEEQIGCQIARIHEYSRQLEAQKEALEQANVRLQALAITDGLTGLRNHRDFHEALERETRSALQRRSPLSLILLDVDRFKQYNDAFGHPAGDEVLKIVSEVLLRLACPSAGAFRYGGEEFAVLLPGASTGEACQVAERLRAEIEAYAWPRRAVTVSLGASTQEAEAGVASDLLEEADRALYRSKNVGRNRVSHFDVSDLSRFDLANFAPIRPEAKAAHPDLSHGGGATAGRQNCKRPPGELDPLDQPDAQQGACR